MSAESVDRKAKLWGFSVAAVGVLLGVGAWWLTGHPWFGLYVAVMFGGAFGLIAAGIVHAMECDRLVAEIRKNMRR